MAAADFCLLDSDFSHRLPEIERWWRASGEGAVLFVHDAGNGHGRETRTRSYERSSLNSIFLDSFSVIHAARSSVSNPCDAKKRLVETRSEPSWLTGSQLSRKNCLRYEARRHSGVPSQFVGSFAGCGG